jgi:DNA-binding Lrp family transcriptional regulator
VQTNNGSEAGVRPLSPLDYKVLYFLLHNGADFSEKEIARRLHMSPSTVNYELNKLRELDVIRGYYYRFNYFKLGLARSAGLFFSAEGGEDPVEHASAIADYPGVEDVVVITGRYDVAVKVYQPSLEHIQDLGVRMARDFRGRLKYSNVMLTLRPYKIHQIPITAAHLAPTKLDDTDRHLIAARSRDPGATLAQVAEELGVSRNTAGSRWARLVDEKVVLKKSLLLNPRYAPQLGLDFRMLVLMDVRPEKAGELCERLSLRPEVHEIATVATNYNVLAVVRTHSIQEFTDFHIMLRKAEPYKGNVLKTSSVLVTASKSRKPAGITFHESTLAGAPTPSVGTGD